MPLTSAIIDRRSSEALLALAHKENLLWATRETDRVFEGICEKRHESGMREQLLEQLVLTPKLSLCNLPDFLWEALDGPFKEQHLANLEAPEDDELPLQPLPVEMISGLLGRTITEDAMFDIVSRVRGTLAEQQHFEFSSGKPAPDVSRESMRRILQRAMRVSLASDYTEAELDAQRQRNHVYGEFSPIVGAMQEYARLARIADRFGLLVRTPILDSQVPGPKLATEFDPRASDAEIAIFRIVAHQLGRTTFRPSLKGSIELANESATASLREMLPFWYARLAEGDEVELRRIQAEIGEASAALKALSGVRTLGKLTTWLAIPISAVETIFSLPPVVGATVSLVGYLSSSKDERVSAKYRWASYGGT